MESMKFPQCLVSIVLCTPAVVAAHSNARGGNVGGLPVAVLHRVLLMQVYRPVHSGTYLRYTVRYNMYQRTATL